MIIKNFVRFGIPYSIVYAIDIIMRIYQRMESRRKVNQWRIQETGTGGAKREAMIASFAAPFFFCSLSQVKKYGRSWRNKERKIRGTKKKERLPR